MKNLKLSVTIVCALLTMQSCNKHDELIAENAEVKKETSLPTGLIKKLAAHSLNGKDLKKVDFMLPNGSTKTMYQIEGDIVLTEDQVIDLISDKNQARHYHTTNLVSQNSTIDIMGVNEGNTALSERQQTALERAVSNFNALDMSIQFNLTFGTEESDKDMVVYNNPNSSEVGGQAGFPSGGSPNKYIQIFGVDEAGMGFLEHVMTHEMGHSIGLRHTDWRTRESCANGYNEGASGGAIAIEDTSAGSDPTSVMRACFDGTETGNFNGNDVIALESIY